MKNFALIGCGAIARLHAKAIQGIEGARLVGVYDYSYTYAEKFAKEFSCIKLWKNYLPIPKLIL